MTPSEEFDLLKKDYLQKSEAHLKELEHLQIEDFDVVTHTVDIVLSQHAVSLSFLSLSMFILNQKRKRSM